MKRKKAKLIAAVGQSYEDIDAPGSLYVVEHVGPGLLNEVGVVIVTLVTVVPAHASVKPGHRIRLGVRGGDMWGLAYVSLT